MLNLWVALVANTVAILTLVFGLYFRRHHRRDLALSYLALNFGVLAVTALLAQSEVGMGLGLGLFGILRSEEHTSELQSRGHLVCRLLLEKKKRTETTQP